LNNKEGLSMKYFIGTIIGIVTFTIIGGMFIVGSPQEVRFQRFDEQRVQHLQALQSDIITYWQQKGVVPSNINDLNDPLRNVIVPKDPEGGTEYEYMKSSDLSFSVCAIFKRKSLHKNIFPKSVPYPTHDRPIIDDSWEHDAGHVCFQRSIDPDYYGGAKTQLR